MRLSEKQKEQVLAAALRYMTSPALTRAGERWGVIGRSDSDSKLWTYLLVHRVEDNGSVWWTGNIGCGYRLRRDAVLGLVAEGAAVTKSADQGRQP